jgi:hypothetical protein
MELAVNVALAFICLRDEEIGDMATDMVLIADRISSKNLLQSTRQPP